MKKLLITLLFVSISIMSMSQIRYTPFYTKIEFRDTAKFIKPIKIGLVSLTSTATELNLLHNSGLTSSDISNIRNSSSNLQTQINTKAPIANPQFTGVPRVGTDTVSTRAYARSVAGTGTIVEGATDTTYVIKKVEYKLDSTKAAGVQLHVRSPYWTDTTALIATKNYVDTELSTLIIPSTSSIYELQGIVGTTSGFPVNGDSTIIHSFFEQVNYIDIFRDGILQTYNNGLSHNIGTVTDSYVFIKASGTVIVKPTLTTGEKIRIKTLTNTTWNALTSEGTADPLESGLMAYWKMDETTGSTMEDSYSTNVDGTISAGVTLAQTGIDNYAYDFNGTSSYVNIGTADCHPTSGISISLWFNSANITNDQNFLDCSYYTGTGWTGYRVVLGADGFINFLLGTGTATVLDKSTPSTGHDNGVWHHVVCTWDGSNAYIYVDKVKSLPTSFNTDIAYVAQSILKIGANTYRDNFWYGGLLDNIRIYNRALSDAEVANIYDNEL